VGVDASGAARPPASAGHALVWADDLERVLLVNAGLGGLTDPPQATRTRVWSWDGASWQVLDDTGPPIRNLAAVAYDTRRHALVIHGGGYDGNRIYGDTWEWSMAGGWRQLMGPGPGVRDHTMMAFDAERGRLVLFSGASSTTNILGDTWEHDGNAWARVATTGPAARVHHAMEYDAASKRVVIFGGVDPPSTDLGDSWAWSGSEWTRFAETTTPRTHARMAYHAGLGTMVVVGSISGSGIGMLTLREGRWVALSAPPEPAGRYLPGVAFDARRGVLVLFGGGSGNTLFNDTWEFDGAAWRSIP
jgi:hypothetical protein